MFAHRRRALVRRVAAAALLSALVVGAAARTGSTHVQAAVPRSTSNTLTIGWTFETQTLDPVNNPHNQDIWVFVNIYDMLVRTANDGASLNPDLATSWDVSNG